MEPVVTWWGIPAVPLVIALVQLAKAAGFPSRYAGLLAAGLGLLGGALSYWFADSALAAAVVNGLVAGLGAAGVWSTVKNATQGPDDPGSRVIDRFPPGRW